MSRKRAGKVNIDGASAKLNEILENYYGSIFVDVMTPAIEDTADDIKDMVVAAAPRETGFYAGTIGTKSQVWKKGSRKGKTNAWVYAESGGYQIAHLLEHGHAKVNGGRVAPSPKGGHWEPAEQKTFDVFISKFIDRLREATNAFK